MFDITHTFKYIAINIGTQKYTPFGSPFPSLNLGLRRGTLFLGWPGWCSLEGLDSHCISFSIIIPQLEMRGTLYLGWLGWCSFALECSSIGVFHCHHHEKCLHPSSIFPQHLANCSIWAMPPLTCNHSNMVSVPITRHLMQDKSQLN